MRQDELRFFRRSPSPSRALQTINSWTSVSQATVKLVPPSRRRPLSFTWAGPSRAIIDRPSTPAGPC